MKRFLISFSLFILLVGSVALGLFVLSDYVIKQRENNLLKISKNINKVFIGDSNVECAVNDSMIPNSINIAQSGEAYMYTYAKIKSLLEYNDQIKTIYIGFSFWDLIKFTEKIWLFSNEFVIEKITLYNYLLNYYDKSVLIKNNPVAYIRGVLKSILSNFQVFKKSFHRDEFNGRLINFGGYENSGRDKLQEDIKKNSFKEQVFEEGLFQIEYLKKISELCRQKSIKLVLLNTPKHIYYYSNIPEAIRQNWISVRNSLSRDSLLDLSRLSIPDSCFGDLTHLNAKGAKLFSRYLNEKLR
jgi:hypothetical protein